MQLMVMGFDIVPFQRGEESISNAAWLERKTLNYTLSGLNIAQVKCAIISFKSRVSLNSSSVVFQHFEKLLIFNHRDSCLNQKCLHSKRKG